MKRRTVVLALGLVIGAGASASPSSLGAQSSSLDSSSSPTVVIDLNDPDGLRELEQRFESGEDFVVQSEFGDTAQRVPSGPEREALDRAAAKEDTAVQTQLCSDLPKLERTASAQAYLGCDPSDGVDRLGMPVDGLLDQGLAEAFAEVLGIQDGNDIKVIVKEGNLTVSIPAEALKQVAMADGAEIDRRLLLTAYSHEEVKSVQFTIDGDCLSYATATGGDICATVNMNQLESVMDR